MRVVREARNLGVSSDKVALLLILADMVSSGPEVFWNLVLGKEKLVAAENERIWLEQIKAHHESNSIGQP